MSTPGRARVAYIQREGGIAKSRLFTKCFLALLGQWPWQRMVPIPPELVLLPPSAPLSIYNFACWARQTFVALAVAQSLRPVRHADVDLRDIGAIPGRTRAARRPTALRRKALTVAEQWIRERQEADGSWGGIQPPWVWGIVALAALGHGFEDPTLRRAVDGWQGFMVQDGDRLRPEACQSPVWDTGLAVLALRACGVAADHPQLARAGAYLLREEVTASGDWSVRVPDLAPGGWAFEYENDLYPDTDDAAVIALALRQLGIGGDAVTRGLDWLAGMQSRDGGWGAFDVDNQAMWLYRSRSATSARSRTSRAPTSPRTRSRRSGRRTATTTPSTAVSTGSSRSRSTTAPGSAAGASTTSTEPAPRCPRSRHAAFLPIIPRCAAPSHGSTPSSRRTAASARTFARTPTPRGAAALRSRPRRRPPGRCSATWPQETLRLRVRGRAADYLCAAQQDDGDWEETHFTGTGFPLDFMIRYHLYRITFPLLALGRLRERLSE